MASIEDTEQRVQRQRLHLKSRCTTLHSAHVSRLPEEGRRLHGSQSLLLEYRSWAVGRGRVGAALACCSAVSEAGWDWE